MIALIQRVFEAEVSARGSIKSKIGEGLVVYIGIDQNDTLKIKKKLLVNVIRKVPAIVDPSYFLIFAAPV